MTTATRQHWKCDACGCEAHCACRESDEFDAALTRLQRADYSLSMCHQPYIQRIVENSEREVEAARAELRRLYDAARGTEGRAG